MVDDTGPAVGAVPVLSYPTVSLFLFFLSLLLVPMDKNHGHRKKNAGSKPGHSNPRDGT